MTTIAITREMGALGTEIATRVAAALTIPLVHREIGELAVDHWGAEKWMMNSLTAVRPGPFKMLRGLAHRNVAYISSEILSIAMVRSAVFRGWGAAQLLYKVPHALCVHIGAPYKVRVARIIERSRLDKRSATRIVRESDAIRAELGRAYYQLDWTDPDEYDLSLNTERTSVDDAVEEILTLARSATFQETPESGRKLKNLELEALARATLYNNPATRDLRIHVEASGDELVLGGIVNDGEQREQVIRAITGIPRRISVTSRLRAPSDYRTRTSSI